MITPRIHAPAHMRTYVLRDLWLRNANDCRGAPEIHFAPKEVEVTIVKQQKTKSWDNSFGYSGHFHTPFAPLAAGMPDRPNAYHPL